MIVIKAPVIRGKKHFSGFFFVFIGKYANISYINYAGIIFNYFFKTNFALNLMRIICKF